MPEPKNAVTFVWPGDLHLTDAAQANYSIASKLMDEINTLIQPDFVQFAGDNVQHARPEEFRLFNDLRSRLTVAHHVLVGDHDVHQDPVGHGFRKFVGEPVGAFTHADVRFIRLNTLERPRLGFATEQIEWFAKEVDAAVESRQRIVVFQHHYAYKVWEQFEGHCIDRWREIIQTRRIAAIFCGHTHYGQIANDGRNIHIASRSIGDPEGGAPGYTLAHIKGDDLAVVYRESTQTGPIVLITHPREALLATGPAHIVSRDDHIEARIWSAAKVLDLRARVDRGAWQSLIDQGAGYWWAPLETGSLSKGEHDLLVRLSTADGGYAEQRIRFMFDPTARYTAVPQVRPAVTGTEFC